MADKDAEPMQETKIPKLVEIGLNENALRAAQINLLVSINSNLIVLVTELARISVALLERQGEDQVQTIDKVARAIGEQYGNAVLKQMIDIVKKYG